MDLLKNKLYAVECVFSFEMNYELVLAILLVRSRLKELKSRVLKVQTTAIVSRQISFAYAHF